MNSNENIEFEQDGINMENVLLTTEYSESEMTMSTEGLNMTSTTEGRNNMETERPSKRNREINSDEIWTTVARKAKKFGREGIENGTITIPEDIIEVCLTCQEKLPKQFGLAKMLKSEGIQNVIKVKYLNAFKVLIQFNSEDSAESMIESKVFKESGFKCQKTLEISQSYGVIKDVDLDLSEEEILEGISSETVILAVKRLKRRNTNDGRWEESESVRICFKGAHLPTHVYIYDTRANVDIYTYPVTQCSRCWRFGHSRKMCPSLKMICPKCSENHQNCETMEFYCNNCTGKHMAMAKICPVFLKEKKVRELMAESNCSYKKALTLYIPPVPQPVHIYQDPPLPAPTEIPRDNIMDTTLPETVATASYASVTKESSSKSKKKSKADKRRNRKTPTKEREDDIFEYVSETSEGDKEEQPAERKRSKDKEQISWLNLVKKLKHKLFEEANNSWEDKIRGCVNILFEVLLSWLLKFIADKPGCNFIKQLWIATTQTSQ